MIFGVRLARSVSVPCEVCSCWVGVGRPPSALLGKTNAQVLDEPAGQPVLFIGLLRVCVCVYIKYNVPSTLLKTFIGLPINFSLNLKHLICVLRPRFVRDHEVGQM